MKYPLLLKPHLEHPIWSGKKLNSQYNKENDSKIGECWEMSTIQGKECIVSNGIFQNQNLYEVLKSNPDYTKNKSDRLDLLFKLIDTDDKLSIQVHPDNNFAREYENQNGKTEAWYILECEENAFIYLGFKEDMTFKETEDSIKENTLEDKLNKINVKKGDYYFIKSGTIHALGKGITVAEIQQSSSVTYRLYDYGRRDKNGNPRELHLEKGVKVLNLKKCNLKEINYKTKIRKKNQLNLIQKGEFFTVFNALIDKTAGIKTDDYMLITILDGSGNIEYDGGKINVIKGNSIFVPSAYSITIKGNLELLANTPS